MRKTFLAALCGAVLSAGLAAPVFAGDRLDNIVGTNTLRVGTPRGLLAVFVEEGRTVRWPRH